MMRATLEMKNGRSKVYTVESERDVVSTEQGYKITTVDGVIVHFTSDEVKKIEMAPEE
jgi:uncharacterized protein YrrD